MRKKTFFFCLKNSHVGDDALLAFRQYFDASPTNLIKGQQHHVERAGEERTAFLFGFIEREKKISCTPTVRQEIHSGGGVCSPSAPPQKKRAHVLPTAR
jgi:hypothetical protein